jgi:RHS repeat-associated protein
MLTKRDALNNQNTFIYDSLGRLVRDDDAATGFQTLARSQTSNSYTVTHDTSLNRVSTFKVEDLENGDVKNTNTAPDGTQSVETEGANGVFTITDPDGTMTESTLAPDPRWAMLAPIDATENINTPNGVAYNSTFASAVVLANPFNPLSLVSKTDTFTLNGKTYTSIFTVNNRTFVETSPLNRQTTTIIDTQNRPTQIQFANLSAINLTYDAHGRISTNSSGSGAETRNSVFSYNAAGYLSSFTNPLNQVNGFTYDLAGRVTRQTLADNRQINFGFDANGNMISLTPPSRPAHTFTYNAVNLVSSYTAPNVGGNSTTVFSYNSEKQITRITRPDALQINFAYDAAGRLQTMSVPNGNYAYTYNATTGLSESFTAPGGDVLTYEYDGFLPTRQTWTGTITGNVSQTFNNDLRIASQSINDANTVNFSYDDDNLLTGAGGLSLTRNAQNGLLSGTTLGNTIDTYTYSNFGEPVNYNAKFNLTTLYDVGYVRDKLGRIIQKTETIGGITTLCAYGYDLSGRLTTVTLNNAPQPLVIYAYDNSDNRISINVGGNATNASYDNQDRLTNYGTTTYSYTANGELQSKTNGVNTTLYNYDVVGNLRNATLPNGTNIEYLIDAQNRRIGKKVNGTLIQGFLYQNQFKPVAELDGSSNVVSRFVYGSRSNTPDYMIKNGTTYRIITDQIGSVRLVVDVASGNIAQRIDYDEFGVVLLDTNPNFQPFGFAGGLYDSNTQLTRFGARDYDAETGRWMAKDPILFDGGQFNLYSYTDSDPINFLDETGFGKFTDLFKPSADPNSYTDALELTQYPNAYNEGIKELNKKIKELNDKIAKQTDLRHQLSICVYKKDKKKEAERKRKLKEELNKVEARILELGDEIAHLKNNLNSIADKYNSLRKFNFGNQNLPAVINPVR